VTDGGVALTWVVRLDRGLVQNQMAGRVQRRPPGGDAEIQAEFYSGPDGDSGRMRAGTDHPCRMRSFRPRIVRSWVFKSP
jgi:hypothetical protein